MHYGIVAEEVTAVVQGEPVDLIETLAQRIADQCLTHEAVQEVEVTVHKPDAPITVPFDDVTITIPGGARDACQQRPDRPAGTRLRGSSRSTPPTPPCGTRSAPWSRSAATSATAWRPSRARSTRWRTPPDVRVKAVSPVYETEPWGVEPGSQPDYFNAVVLIKTTLPPSSLLERAQAIEEAFVRVRDERWGPRTIDVDIVSYQDVVSADPVLTLPHPRAHERAFVLVPWHDIDPQAELPGVGPVAALLERIGRHEVRARADAELRLPE